MSTKIVNAVDVQADTNFPSIEIPQNMNQNIRFTIQCVWGAITGTKDCTLHEEVSEDGENWDIVGSPVVMSADNSSTSFLITHYDNKNHRVVFTQNNSSNVNTLVLNTSLPSTIVTAVA
jgi:hypothetical protein